MHESLRAALHDATKGSWELDSQLWQLFTKEPRPEISIAKMRDDLGREPSDWSKKVIWEGWQHGLEHPPHYTESVDKALMLLPVATWNLSRWEQPGDPLYWFDLYAKETITVRHNVPAIAICIAALEVL